MSYPLRVQSTAFRGQTFWVVVIDSGTYDGTGDGRLYLTREDADQAMARTLYLRIHLTDLPHTLSGADYAARALAAGIVVHVAAGDAYTAAADEADDAYADEADDADAAAADAAAYAVDDSIRANEYVLVYGSYGPGQAGSDPDGTREVSRRLGLARLYGLRAETPAPAPIVRPEPITRPCALCGTPTSLGMLMTSARGSVCPDCYDVE